ncbi:unnamed protein product [Auanema sp. JU1783]|nr:unnamed protein product [Auanema sp. JU1783]
MARASLPKRIWLTLAFIFQYIFIFVFKDIPQCVLQRKKKVENQVIVITGGAMGIGKESAKLFALDHGAKVCILDVNEKEGLKTIDEITQAGGEAYFYPCDISNYKSIEEIAEKIHNDPRLGFVDILVANAAILKFGEIMDLSIEDYKKSNDVNILGQIYTIKIFLPKMIAANRGHIATVGSICSFYGEYCGTAYCTAKFAIRGFMEALHMELMEKELNSIKITNIHPYFVRTNLIGHLDEPYSTYFDVVPLDRCSREVVDAILKERIVHFIPSGITFLCLFLKCLATRNTIPLGRKLFNFTYEPKGKLASVKAV